VSERAPQMIRKSGLMVGLGETLDEVVEVLEDLVQVGCQAVTVGQYLQPTTRQVAVARYWTPDELAAVADRGQALGLEIFAGPFVRSSYRAEEALERVRK
jgi:lipoic acid synthetase